MIERTTEQRYLEDYRAGRWYTLMVTPARTRFLDRWADHLGLAPAALMARIVAEGTIQLALDDLSGTARLTTAAEQSALAETMMRDLERYLDEAEALTVQGAGERGPASEESDAPDGQP